MNKGSKIIKRGPITSWPIEQQSRTGTVTIGPVGPLVQCAGFETSSEDRNSAHYRRKVKRSMIAKLRFAKKLGFRPYLNDEEYEAYWKLLSRWQRFWLYFIAGGEAAADV